MPFTTDSDTAPSHTALSVGACPVRRSGVPIHDRFLERFLERFLDDPAGRLR
jgi:hypothetical protein